jgi:hypothetical protein
MAAPTKLTQAQIDELKVIARYFKHNGGNAQVPADHLLILLNAYVVTQ